MENIFKQFNTALLIRTIEEISKSITHINLVQLRWLCNDDIKSKHDFAVNLLRDFQSKKSTDVSCLAEVLWQISRRDLVNEKLIVDMRQYESFIKNPNNWRISSYR